MANNTLKLNIIIAVITQRQNIKLQQKNGCTILGIKNYIFVLSNIREAVNNFPFLPSNIVVKCLANQKQKRI